MPRITLTSLLLAGARLGTATAEAPAGSEPNDDAVKVVVHVNFPEPGRQGHGKLFREDAEWVNV